MLASLKASPKLICPRCRRIDDQGQLRTRELRLLRQRGPLDAPATPPLACALETESLLECYASDCRARYPIVGGIPIVFKRPEAVDLALGPPLDVLELGVDRLLSLVEGQDPERALPQLLSRLARYAWAGFHDQLPGEWHLPGIHLPVHAVEVMRWLQALDEPARCALKPRAVLGSALGREAFEARSGETLLCDAHLPSLLAARRLLRDGELELPAPLDRSRWAPLRITAPGEPRASVAFVCCDVQDPPFEAGAFGSVLALNLLDSVGDPFVALGQAHALTAEDGLLTLTSPFSWREEVTPRERWLSSLAAEHLPSGAGGDRAMLEALLQGTFQPPMRVRAQGEFTWMLRSTAREVVIYRSLGLVCEASV